MGYYVRAFCLSTDVPPLATVLQWLDTRGRHLEIDQQLVEVNLHSPTWNQAALRYKTDKLPIIVECNRDDGTKDCLMREEISEFLEFIGKPGLSLPKREVINHLNNTCYTIACQLPTSDIDDDGYDANGQFLNYFVVNCRGMIQADGEGFYKGAKLVVKLGYD